MWNEFRVSSSEEVTINNTLCANGLFQIASSEEVLKEPKVHAAVQDNKIIVAVDHSIVLLENENVGECKFLSFQESEIDCVFLSDSGKLVVCCLSNGNINGFSITGQPLFNLRVDEEDVGENRTFAGISDSLQDIFVMCTSGRIYKVDNVDQDKFGSYIESNGTLIFDETIPSNAQITKVSSRRFDNEIISFVIVPQMDTLTAVFNDSNRIYIYTDEDILPISLPAATEGIRKFHIFKNYLLGLCNNGEIVEICPFTGMIYWRSNVLDHVIDDFVLLESSGDKIELMILTKANRMGQKMLRIVDFSTMQSLYELAMSEHIWLVEQPKSSTMMYYLFGNIVADEVIPQEIEMKIISEALPQHQLKKMICRGLLDKAEHFATQFNLSLLPIHECRINIQVANICECRNTEELRRLFADLLLLLDKVDDNADILLKYWSIEIPDRQMTAEFLEYLLKRLSGGDAQVEVKLRIAEHLRRIETLHLMDPSDSMLEWRKFLNSQNLMKICMEYLSSSISHACLIWSRHSSYLIPNLDTKDLMSILNSLPSTVEPLSIIQWLHHFTPSLLQIHPEFMPLIVDWSINKIRFFESNAAWRENTLEICNSILDIFTNLHFIIVDPRRQYDSGIRKLQSLKFALDEMQLLKQEYNLTIDLSDYINNTLEETTFKLLVGVQTDKIQSFINHFIYPGFLKKNKSPIEPLVNYIKFLVMYRKSFCYWQDRAVIVLELIPDEDKRLHCAQIVLMEAPVPWSPVLEPLVKYSILNHPLAQEIRSLHEQQIVKIIKLKYNWPQNAHNDYVKLISRILKVKSSNMWSDIKSLVKAVPQIEKMAYFCCIHEFAKQENFEMGLYILEELGENRQEVIQYLLEIFINMLEGGIEGSLEKNFIQMLNILSLKSDNTPDIRVEQINRLHLLKNRFENHFDSLTVSDLAEPKDIFTKGLDFITNNLRNYGEHLLLRVWNDVKILTEALCIDFLDGLTELAHICSNVHLSCVIAFDILATIEISGSNCDKILRFCALLLVQQAEAIDTEQTVLEDPLTFALVYKLLTKILQVTKIHYIEALEMIVWVRIVNELYPECALEEYYQGRSQELSREIAQIFVRDHTARNNPRSNRKRESMSIFDQVKSPRSQVLKAVKQNLQITVMCISTIMKIMLRLPDGSKSGWQNRLREFMTSIAEDSMENADSWSERRPMGAFGKPGKLLNSYILCRLKMSLSEHIEKLFKLKMYSILYTIALQMTELQKECGIQFIPDNSLDVFHQKSIKASLSERDFNMIECLSQFVSSKSQVKFLHAKHTDFKSDTIKLNYHKLMENYFNLSGDLDMAIQHRENCIKYQFIQEIRKKKPDFEINCSFENLTLAQMILQVCTVPIDLTLLQKLLKNFSWEGDYQELLILQLLLVLKQQELKFTVSTDAFGREMVVVENSVEDILKQCRPYMNEINKEKLLTKKLIEFMSTANFYFYEIYLSIIEILTEFNTLSSDMSMWKHILEFFKHKMTVRRRTRPVRKEVDAWLNANAEGGMLPNISKYRFPFHLIIKNDLHDTLSEEIFVENCEEWFPLIKIHAMYFHKDATREKLTEITEKFCMTAIKNSISEKNLTEKSDTDEWQFKPSDNSLLKSILKLTKFMSTEWKIFSVLYYVSNYAACGVDHVEAAFECYKYAIDNEKVIMMSERVVDQLMKIKRKYPMIKIQYLLQVHKLNQEKLMTLVGSPVKLIHALYMHESILMPQSPDITHVVEEIAELHALELRVLQVNMLTRWLINSPDTNEMCPDDTLLLDDLQKSCVEEEQCLKQNMEMEDYEKRALYILTSWSVDEAVQFLINISRQNSLNCEIELKIYEWIVRLLDDDTLESKSVIAEKDYVKMKVTSDLKKLGFNLSSSKYHSCDKINLLKRIWQKNDNNPVIVHAMALICLEFEINETKIWDVVLKKMVHFGMRKELLSIVNFISVKQELLVLDGLRAAWEFLIQTPFQKATRVRTASDNDDLCRALCLLQTCPVTPKINLVKLANLCERIDQMHLAAILMMYACKEDRVVIKNLVRKYKSQKMQKELEELELQGILPVLINNATTEIFHNVDN